MGLYGPKIVWMFYGWYSSEFWRINLDNVPCSEEEMELAADGAFVIGYYFRDRVIRRGIAGLTGLSKIISLTLLTFKNVKT